MADERYLTGPERRMKNFWDYYSTMQTAHDKGIHEGREMGRLEANRENALRMKAKGYAITDITEITGLTAEEIEAL